MGPRTEKVRGPIHVGAEQAQWPPGDFAGFSPAAAADSL